MKLEKNKLEKNLNYESYRLVFYYGDVVNNPWNSKGKWQNVISPRLLLIVRSADIWVQARSQALCFVLQRELVVLTSLFFKKYLTPPIYQKHFRPIFPLKILFCSFTSQWDVDSNPVSAIYSSYGLAPINYLV